MSVIDFINTMRPKNESHTHFLLKQISIMFLWRMNCRMIGTEVDMGKSMAEGESNRLGTLKTIVDAVGLQHNGKYDKLFDKDGNPVGFRHGYNIRSVEAKISRGDFRNGFNMVADYSYVICPKDMIQPSELPKKVGLIYVDLDAIVLPLLKNFDAYCWIVKKPRKEYDDRFYKIYNEEDDSYSFDKIQHDLYAQKTCTYISKENTQRQMFNNPFLIDRWW